MSVHKGVFVVGAFALLLGFLFVSSGTVTGNAPMIQPVPNFISTCGVRISNPGTYYVTRDIVCPSGSGYRFTQGNAGTVMIEIDADNVVLDCKNHRMIKQYGGPYFGIHALTQSGVVVRNCHLVGFDDGIFGDSIIGRGILIENNLVNGTGWSWCTGATGIYAAMGSSSSSVTQIILRNNTVEAYPRSGIEIRAPNPDRGFVQIIRNRACTNGYLYEDRGDLDCYPGYQQSGAPPIYGSGNVFEKVFDHGCNNSVSYTDCTPPTHPQGA